MKLLIRGLRDGGEQGIGNVGSDDGCGLKKALVIRREAVDPRGENGLDGGGNLNLGNLLHQLVGAGAAHERPALDQRLDGFFEIKRVALGAFNKKCFKRIEGYVFAKDGLK